MEKVSEEIQEAGQAVQEAARVLDELRGKVKAREELVNSFRASAERYRTELEILRERENKSFDLRKRELELEEALAANESNIEGLRKDADLIEHQIKMASIDWESKKQRYQDLKQPARTGELSRADIEFLQRQTPRVKMSFKEKERLINRFGMQAFMDHVPLI